MQSYNQSEPILELECSGCLGKRVSYISVPAAMECNKGIIYVVTAETAVLGVLLARSSSDGWLVELDVEGSSMCWESQVWLLESLLTGCIREGAVWLEEELVSSLERTNLWNLAWVPDSKAGWVSVVLSKERVARRAENSVIVHFLGGIVLMDIDIVSSDLLHVS